MGSVADAAVCLPSPQVPTHPAPRTVALGTRDWESVPEAKSTIIILTLSSPLPPTISQTSLQ